MAEKLGKLASWEKWNIGVQDIKVRQDPQKV
jgi:hypothetical protein